MCLVRPRAEELRERDPARLGFGGLGSGWRGLAFRLLGLLDRLAGALRAASGRGRELFFRLLCRWRWLFLFVASNPTVLLLSELVRHLAARVAEIELQDRFADVRVHALQHVLPSAIPAKVAGRVSPREQVDRVPVFAVFLDETRVSHRFVDGGECSRRRRVDYF